MGRISPILPYKEALVKLTRASLLILWLVYQFGQSLFLI